jgi:hypothetical protein
MMPLCVTPVVPSPQEIQERDQILSAGVGLRRHRRERSVARVQLGAGWGVSSGMLLPVKHRDELTCAVVL